MGNDWRGTQNFEGNFKREILKGLFLCHLERSRRKKEMHNPGEKELNAGESSLRR